MFVFHAATQIEKDGYTLIEQSAHLAPHHTAKLTIGHNYSVHDVYIYNIMQLRYIMYSIGCHYIVK